ncbi:DUF1934 family protein [Fundicoccus sp. Sow4_D5]|uniref:DUF1934 family protein n=1 Tax=Fundicoccus sp. Sow4_D5 TaxID=3438782 RepID=UPI003F923B27
MGKREVSLEINQWIEYQMEVSKEHYKFMSSGELVELSSFSRLAYVDENGARIELKWRPEGILNPSPVLEIRQPAYSLFFNLDQVTVTPYQTPQGVWDLNVRTLAMSWEQGEGAGRLDLSYELILNEELLGKYDFQLIYR